jgi:putative aminopeptidase FrvX
MKSLALVKALSDANGVSGFEGDVLKSIQPFLTKDVTFTWDLMKNGYIQSSSKPKQPLSIVVDGHLDELGLMVQAITSKGQLRVLAIGSWDVKNLLSQKMRLVTHEGLVLKGIVASKPPHFMTEAERSKPVAIEDLLVDIGCSTREEAVALGVKIGMPLVPDVCFEELVAQQIIMGKALDNRLGCALVVETTLEAVAKGHHNVIGALSTQEEIGGRGAQVTANVLNPDIAIIFEGTPADDTFTVIDEAQGIVGGGVQIRHADRTMISHPGLTALAIQLAKEKGIHYQETVRRGGGTNGAVYHTKGKGVACIVLGVPVRYVHAHYGLAKMADYHAARELALEVIAYLNEHGLDSIL